MQRRKQLQGRRAQRAQRSLEEARSSGGPCNQPLAVQIDLMGMHRSLSQVHVPPFLVLPVPTKTALGLFPLLLQVQPWPERERGRAEWGQGGCLLAGFREEE